MQRAESKKCNQEWKIAARSFTKMNTTETMRKLKLYPHDYRPALNCACSQPKLVETKARTESFPSRINQEVSQNVNMTYFEVACAKSRKQEVQPRVENCGKKLH